MSISNDDILINERTGEAWVVSIIHKEYPRNGKIITARIRSADHILGLTDGSISYFTTADGAAFTAAMNAHAGEIIKVKEDICRPYHYIATTDNKLELAGYRFKREWLIDYKIAKDSGYLIEVKPMKGGEN